MTRIGRRILHSIAAAVPEDRKRLAGWSYLAQANQQREQQNYGTAFESLNTALDLLHDLPTDGDRELRALCYFWQAEATLHGKSRPGLPPLAPADAAQCLELCDAAEAEIQAIEVQSTPLCIRWTQWYDEPGEIFPLGLIEMYRGLALHFSSRNREPGRRQAVSHYVTAGLILGPKSALAHSVMEFIRDIEAADPALKGKVSPSSALDRVPLREPGELRAEYERARAGLRMKDNR